MTWRVTMTSGFFEAFFDFKEPAKALDFAKVAVESYTPDENEKYRMNLTIVPLTEEVTE